MTQKNGSTTDRDMLRKLNRAVYAYLFGQLASAEPREMHKRYEALIDLHDEVIEHLGGDREQTRPDHRAAIKRG